jgi:hypothetical protein
LAVAVGSGFRIAGGAHDVRFWYELRVWEEGEDQIGRLQLKKEAVKVGEEILI